MGVYVQTKQMAMPWECVCFVFALVQHIDILKYRHLNGTYCLPCLSHLCCQWPPQKYPQKRDTTKLEQSNFLRYLLYKMWCHYVCSSQWHTYFLQPGKAVQANAYLVYLFLMSIILTSKVYFKISLKNNPIGFKMTVKRLLMLFLINRHFVDLIQDVQCLLAYPSRAINGTALLG